MCSRSRQDERSHREAAPHSIMLANAPSTAIDAHTAAPLFFSVSEHVVSQEERNGKKNQYPSHCWLHTDSFSIHSVVVWSRSMADKTGGEKKNPVVIHVVNTCCEHTSSAHTLLALSPDSIFFVQ